MAKELKNIDLAAALGCDAGLISRYRQRGMPATSIADAIAWKTANVRPRVKSPKTNEQAGIFSYDEARARREHWAAQSAEMEARRTAGELVLAADVERMGASIGVVVRQHLERMADMLAPALVGKAEEIVAVTIAQYVEDALRLLSHELGKMAVDLEAGK